MREIDKLVKDILTSDGFVFKKTSWYRTTKDFIQILNFQKSHFSNKFYLNLGIDEIQEGKPSYKPEYQFPVRIRIDMLLYNRDLMQSLDFEKEYIETTRQEELKTIVLSGINFLDSINEWNQLRTAISNQSHPIHRACILSEFLKRIKGITLTQ